MYRRVLELLRRHERRLSTFLFVSGFIVDLITYLFLDLPVVNLVFLGYLTLLIVLIFATHAFHRFAGSPVWWKQGIAVLAPLFAQFTLGSLFSGLLIFYTKSAVLAVSWPFLLLLLIVFFGNEAFRSYRSHLIFQTLLFFFALYAYLIFAIPLYVDALGPWIFLLSTALAVAVFVLFLIGLAFVSRENVRKTIHLIGLGAASILVAVVALYFTSLIPPLPLALKESGIYHSITRTRNGEYTLSFADEDDWWEVRRHVVRHVPGTPLYAYSAIFAPGELAASVAHRWMRYDEARGQWRTEALIAFPVAGGRSGGYRGYSLKADPAPGHWIVRIETLQGQVIGRISFTVENVPTAPLLRTEVR